MSAAATAAGYLYASGRLRGRANKDGAQETSRKAEPEHGGERRRVKVAALPEAQPEAQAANEQRPKRAPTVQYRTRRWRPDVP